MYLLAHCSGIFKTGRCAHLDNLALDAELTNLWIRGLPSTKISEQITQLDNIVMPLIHSVNGVFHITL